jgi:D-glycero-D-manno-heptose 1,7-bisphosphate phosphatase
MGHWGQKDGGQKDGTAKAEMGRGRAVAPAHDMSERAPARGSALRRAVFLDRDGVLNRALIKDGKPNPPRSLAEFELLPGVPEACARLKQAGLLLVVATNQPDVGRGTLARETVESLHAHLCRILPIDRVEVSYDSGHEQPPSELRKSRPGLLLRAGRDLGIDLQRSFMVGDRWRDIDCGHAVGCTTFLVDYGYAEELRCPPDFRVKNLAEAADQILRIL